MPPAARMTDKIMHDSPHCHAPIHPPAPVPTPMPHPCTTHQILIACAPTVMINSLQAAIVTSNTPTCEGEKAGCVPGGPGIIIKGSSSVMITGLPAARAGDIVAFATCVGPIPGPTGKILPPCSTNVMTGG
jgi:uncharacterized Zn-binding protein involved in type VI secretion